jgi:hypothetical protein
MATNARDAAVGALLDDLLLDIFARLPEPVDLLRCAATCRWWLRLVGEDLLRGTGVKNAPFLLGAFYQIENPEVPEPTATEKTFDSPPKFGRLLGLPPVHHVDRPGFGLFSILTNHDGLFNYAKPLASRHGLLLLRLLPAPLDYRKLHLAVCHPLLGGVHLLPPPPVHLQSPFLMRDVTGYALITGHGGEGLDNQGHRRLAFRVLFTVNRLDGAVYAYSYSSVTAGWSAPTMCPKQMRGLAMAGPRAAVVDDRGTAHWLYRGVPYFYTLNVSADSARVTLTKIPMSPEIRPPFPCIASGGKLSFLVTRPQGHDTLLQLWTRQDQDDNGGGWQCSHLITYQGPYASTMIIGFAESRGAILIKGCSGLVCFDIEDKELELVRESQYTSYPTEICSNSTCQGYTSCTQCAYNNCVLYEMDWPSYILHISAWSPRGETG